MSHLVQSIAPIFVIIVLGWILKSRRIMTASFIGALNRLILYIAIPDMVFKEVAGVGCAGTFLRERCQRP